MSDKVYDIPAEWAKRAWINAGEVRGDVQAVDRATRKASGPSTANASTGSRPSPRSRTRPSTSTTSRSNGSKTASPMSLTIASTGICRSARTRPRSSGKATIRRSRAHITYAELARRVGLFANVLKAHGVKKGDRVTIYLPMIPEAAYAMLACARIGAIHSVVFGGFSPKRLQVGSRTPSLTSSSPRTRVSAAAGRSRSRPTSTPRIEKSRRRQDRDRRQAHRRRDRAGKTGATFGCTRPKRR